MIDVKNGNLLLELMLNFNMIHLVTKSIRVAQKSDGILDLIFVENFPGDTTVSVHDGLSDHKLVFLTTNYCPVKKSRDSKRVFNFSAADDEAIIDTLDLRISDFEMEYGILLKILLQRALVDMHLRNRKRNCETLG